MNKNLLIIAAAAAAYALLRPKTTVTTPTTASVPAGGGGGGANTYVQQQAAAGTTTTTAASGNLVGNWLSTAGGLITGATGLVQQGSSAWHDITGALGIKPAVQNPVAAPTASITAEGDGGVWAGPNYQTSVWAGPKYQDS